MSFEVLFTLTLILSVLPYPSVTANFRGIERKGHNKTSENRQSKTVPNSYIFDEKQSFKGFKPPFQWRLKALIVMVFIAFIVMV